MATSIVTTSPILRFPVASELTADMRTTLDAYMNTLGLLTILSRRRTARREEFLKVFSPEIAAGGDARIDAALQKYNEWKKVDEEQRKQIDGLEEISEKLWQNFRTSAKGFPEGASFLLQVKIELLDAQIEAQNAGIQEIASHRKDLQRHLDAIERLAKAGDDPASIQDDLRLRIGPQLVDMPFDGPEVLEEMIAVALKHVPAPAAAKAASSPLPKVKA